MSATLVAVVLALVLSHTFPALTQLRRFDWFVAYQGFLNEQFGSQKFWQQAGALALGVLPPLVLVSAIQYVLSGWAYGLPSFVFSLVALFYVWGPRDLDLDVDAVLNATDHDARLTAAEPLYPEDDEPNLEGPALVEAVFRCALWRWFAPLMWFLLLGPLGGVAYRLVALSGQGEVRARLPDQQADMASTVRRIMDWPAAQIMTFCLALAANFDAVIAAWRRAHKDGVSLSLQFLDRAARASVRAELAEEEVFAGDGPARAPALLELRDAMSLVWRILLLWLAALALFVLAGFVN